MALIGSLNRGASGNETAFAFMNFTPDPMFFMAGRDAELKNRMFFNLNPKTDPNTLALE